MDFFVRFGVRQCSIKPQIQSSRPMGRLWAGTRRIDTSSEAFHRHHVHGPQPAGRIIIFPIGPYCCCTTSISKEIEPVSGPAPVIRPNFVQTAPLPSPAPKPMACSRGGDMQSTGLKCDSRSKEESFCFGCVLRHLAFVEKVIDW